MESSCFYQEKAVMHELTEGVQMAKQLRVNLNSPEAREIIIDKILSSYRKALLILQSGDSSISTGSTQIEFDQHFIDHEGVNVVSKKPKMSTTWEDQVRICTDNGFEGNTNDGYNWRKYGQKLILGAKFPRSYYRCTCSKVQNCLATKQVQKIDEKPTKFEITYKGKHTCNHVAQSVAAPPPLSPDHKIKASHHQQPSSPNPSEMLSKDLGDSVPTSFSFPSTPFQIMEDYQQFQFPDHSDEELFQGYSPLFISPDTSESDYFIDWGSSPSLNFMVDQADVDHDFNFNNSFF